MFGQCGRSEIEDGVTGADADARAALPCFGRPPNLFLSQSTFGCGAAVLVKPF